MRLEQHAGRLATVLALGAALLLAGCDDSHAEAVEGCEDLAQAVAERQVTCAEAEAGQLGEVQRQQSVAETKQAFIDGAVNGDCDKIVKIRDKPSLRNECIPQLETFSCNAVLDGDLPSSCDKQIIHD